jgi:anthranilate synthase component 1
MALSIIHELEPINRGLFGGVVGYFDFSGNADLAIAIRTLVLRDGRGFVQAGAGIVLDSLPESENLETISKASAPLKAMAMANSMKKLP